MRKPPPISTSSPRETTASRPCASAARTSRTAAALLLTVGQEPGGVDVAGAASARRQVVLQVRVAGGQSCDPRRRRRGHRGPAEVGVHDDPGGVDDGLEGRLESGREIRRRPPFDERRRLLAVLEGGRAAAGQILPHAAAGRAQRGQRRRASVLGLEGADAWPPAEAVDGRQDAGRRHEAAAPGRTGVLPLRQRPDAAEARGSGKGGF